MTDTSLPRGTERCPNCGQPLVLGECTLCGSTAPPPLVEPIPRVEPSSEITATTPVTEPGPPRTETRPSQPVAPPATPASSAVDVLVPRERTQSLLALTIGLLIVTLALSLFTFLKTSSLDSKLKSETTARGAAEDRITILEGAQKNQFDQQQALRGQLDAQAAADPTAIASRVQGSVYTVETSEGLGSAWVAASDHVTAKFVTNYHVIASAWERGVTSVKIFQDNGPSYDGTIEQALPDVDLALIDVTADIPKLKESNLTPRPGDTIVVIGSPLGFGGSVSTGTVSALREELGINYIQFAAPISPGNSGGPVVNSLGEVIGITELDFGRVVQGAENAKFAIPVNLVCIKMQVC